jgi:hypothetical protein
MGKGWLPVALSALEELYPKKLAEVLSHGVYLACVHSMAFTLHDVMIP